MARIFVALFSFLENDPSIRVITPGYASQVEFCLAKRQGQTESKSPPIGLPGLRVLIIFLDFDGGPIPIIENIQQRVLKRTMIVRMLVFSTKEIHCLRTKMISSPFPYARGDLFLRRG
jgi:hypothetical protein